MKAFASCLLVLVLVVAGCAADGEPVAEMATTVTTTPVSRTPVTTTGAPSPTTAVVTTTTTMVVIEAEWMAPFPAFGVPGDKLEICGVTRGPSSLTVVVSDPVSGDTWPSSGRVRPFENGQWCWESEFPAEMQDQGGDSHPIAPGTYDIRLEYEGQLVLQSSLEISSEELVAALPPSQTAADAVRDGVVPELAALPFYRRVRVETEIEAEEGIWMLTRLSRAVEEESWATGCGLGDPTGVYPVDIICTVEYGEILLVEDAAIVKAFPMPGAVPGWVHLTDQYVYSGRIGDGGLPDSTLVRIDRSTMDVTVVVIPAEFDGGSEWLPGWHIAADEYRERFYAEVHVNSDDPGTRVSSWMGDFTIDLDGIDAILAEVAGV